MNDIRMEERISIRDSARTLKKYGSTSSYNCRRHERYLKHELQESDTLQGLALKYSVTMEEIRRANRLWANDSIFLREFLLIPSRCGSELSEYGSPSKSPPSRSQSLPNGQTVEEPSYTDFLVKIDCSIASTKSQLLTAQDNSEFLEEESRRSWRRRSVSSRSSLEGSRPTEVVVVRDSLQRLEKETDEIFEL